MKIAEPGSSNLSLLNQLLNSFPKFEKLVLSLCLLWTNSSTSNPNMCNGFNRRGNK